MTRFQDDAMQKKARSSVSDVTTAARALFRQGKIDEAAVKAGDALRNARRLTQTSQEGGLAFSRAANLRGDIYFEVGRFGQAERRYRESINSVSETALSGGREHRIALADAYTGLGHTLRAMGRYEESIGFQERGLELYRGLARGDPNLRASLALAMHYMGDVLADVGKPEEAMPYYLHELRIVRRLYYEDSSRLSYLVHGLNGVAYRLLDMQRFDRALAYFNQSLRYQSKADMTNMPNESWTHHGIGVTLLQKRDLDGAISHLEKALEMRRRISAKNKRFLGALKNTLTALGDSRTQKGEKEKALSHYVEALRILNSRVYMRQVISSKIDAESIKITERIADLRSAL